MDRGRGAVAGVFGLVAVTVLVLGIVDTFVWLPVRTAPTTPLAGIHAALDRSHDPPPVIAGAVVWVVFWSPITAIALLVTVPLHPAALPLARRLGALGTVEVALLVLGGIGMMHWGSAFAMGMSVSDDLPPGIGTTTPFGFAMLGGGLILLLLAGAGALTWTASRGRRTTSRDPAALPR